MSLSPSCQNLLPQTSWHLLVCISSQRLYWEFQMRLQSMRDKITWQPQTVLPCSPASARFKPSAPFYSCQASCRLCNISSYSFQMSCFRSNVQTWISSHPPFLSPRWMSEWALRRVKKFPWRANLSVHSRWKPSQPCLKAKVCGTENWVHWLYKT